MGRSRVSEADPLGKGRRGRPASKPKDTLQKTGFDGSQSAPWRKTVSIFKQPVTLVHTTSREAKKPTTEQLKRGLKGSQERPYQLLWAKRLEGISASLPMALADLMSTSPGFLSSSLELAGRMEKAVDVLNPHTAAASLFNAIHASNGPTIHGQKGEKKKIDADPFTGLTADQPLVINASATHDDIVAQEKRILDARKRLQEVRKHFG